MKKMFKYASLGAIAFVGAVSFSACSSSDEIVDNPDYNPVDNTVKTQFTIAFPGNVAKTRQSAATVQNDQDIASFRGMDNIVLYPFAATGLVNEDPIASTSTKLGDQIQLTSIIEPTTLSVTNSIPASTSSQKGLTEKSNSVLYNDVSIPVGTGSFLFYGKAIGDNNFVNGALTMTQGATPQPENITFDPVQIYPSTTTASTRGAALATYLSSIARAEHWAECTVTTSSSESWYNASLGELYTNFTSLHAGSSRTVQAAIQDLYATVKNNTDAVSENIRTAITNSTYASANGTTGLLDFTEAIGNSDATYYPGDVKLPDGAAMLEYTASTKTFTQKIDGDGNTGDVTAKFTDYVYPASLYYYSNSGIKTSNSSKQAEYDGNQDWSTISGKYTDGTSVGTSTRSVAILDPIQYGVGRLDATVKADAGDAGTLYDKNGEEYKLPDAGFTVTGILIGGQKQVKFDFTTNTEATSTYTIFDDITKSQSGTTLKATTTASDPNYTLALQTAANEAIYVAVELVNNGAYFQGADGVVPTGCKFYLVAQLTPSEGDGYDATTLNQIFKQDYNTIVTFTINKGKSKDDPNFPSGGNTTGLGKAYNTIPDLRTPKMELGLSVDLTWQSGLRFDVNL